MRPSTDARRVSADERTGLQRDGTAANTALDIAISVCEVRNVATRAVLVGPRGRVHEYRILDVTPGNMFPSDDFGVVVDLALRE